MSDKEEMLERQNGALADGEKTVEEVWEAAGEDAEAAEEVDTSDVEPDAPYVKAKGDASGQHTTTEVVDPTED